ncbi:DNA mismatch repair endonuclease MutL [Facklamia miroungae]|uniref:DNA mismatch repair protein MutL n=1 Tax=Facklamia miroungae TaxID=120956 RepID=A0A1G7PQR4_9LACT|nr:DNA mismatch repair endonuclease MutL [Facklamia miroungae]NKZ28772.1 DNA mismatch repair endonuclease MutL [Facklamia miroungae]SDF87770.1 DNA mismatch repair protein MutL [Facklamia miroungae]
MGVIKQMDTALANQIAAGEVVERPASVVKELCENAIDAQADHIQVEVKEAGIQQIIVIDNGHGMIEEDLHHSVLAHATSKIYSLSDLFQISSLGFRGEALASIASVAKVRMESTWNGDNQPAQSGHYIEVENSKLTKQGTCPPRNGTTVQVDSIFYNTPARLKHLASLQTEMRHILKVMQDLALAYPSISFTLIVDGDQILQTVGKGDLKQTIAQLYSPQQAREMLAFDVTDLEFSLKGLISPPTLTRTSRNYIHWIVNGRTVKSPFLTNVLTRAYGKQLMIGRFPISFIQISTDPRLVDVNVHPTKQTIRLSKEDELAKLLTQAVETTLRQNRVIPEAGTSLFKPSRPYQQNKGQLDGFSQSSYIQESNQPIHNGEQAKPSSALEANFEPTQTTRELTYPSDFSHSISESGEKEVFEQEEAKPIIDFSQLRYVGQIHGTYLVAEGPTSFYLIDQHAAQERIRYEKLMADQVDVTQQQDLLLPKLFSFDLKTAQLAQEYGDHLQEIGIILQPFGPRSYQMQSHPTWVEVDELDHLIPDLLDRLSRQDNLSVNELKETSIIMQSCRGAIKANHRLAEAEAIHLLAEMNDLDDPLHCPHGRPVFIEFDPTTIEKLFKRIQDHHLGGRAND